MTGWSGIVHRKLVHRCSSPEGQMVTPANGGRCTNTAGSTSSAVSRKPMALPDALVYELYGLTEDVIRTVEGGEK